MGSTNSTTYYGLSQFVGTDKPAWLQDYNGDMVKIDAGINEAKVAADNAAQAASDAQGDASAALGDISDLNTTVGNLSNTVGTAVGNINTINSLIGNGTPTTTDQTIIGAINELNSNKLSVSRGTIQVTADGIKSWSDLFDEVIASLNTVISGLAVNAKILYRSIDVSGFTNLPCEGQYFYGNLATLWGQGIMLTAGGNIRFTRLTISEGANQFLTGVIASDGTVSAPVDIISSVATNGDTISVHYEIYSE